jgi:hypothetical protein
MKNIAFVEIFKSSAELLKNISDFLLRKRAALLKLGCQVMHHAWFVDGIQTWTIRQNLVQLGDIRMTEIHLLLELFDQPIDIFGLELKFVKNLDTI